MQKPGTRLQGSCAKSDLKQVPYWLSPNGCVRRDKSRQGKKRGTARSACYRSEYGASAREGKGMRRREFITLIGGALAASPFAVRAQADGIKRLTILMSVADDPEGQARVAAFRQGLQQLGWAEGRNVRIEYRWGNADADRLKTYAAEAVTAGPAGILVGGTTALIPTHKATRSIPIVFVGSADPVGQGFVERLPRPGDNMTGFTIFEVSLV